MKLPPRTLKGILLGWAVFILLAFAILSNPAPRVETKFSGATVQMSLDRGWVSGAGDCVILEWNVEGIKSIYINGGGEIGWGEKTFCLTANENIPEIEITAQDGTRRIFQPDVVYLLNLIVYLLGFVGILSTGILALYYACNHHLDNPFPLWGMSIAVIALIIIGELLRLSSSNLVTDVLSLLRRLFAHPYWHLFGVILAGLIYLPLIVQALRRNLKSKFTSDLIVIVGFLLFVFLLYLPFGFESIGLWEEWVVHAYLEGRPSRLETELVSRLWALIPHTLAYLISPESFSGYHLVNFLMFWGKLVLVYGILRQLKIAPLYAFLMTMLFMVYPVNSGLMSLRSLPMQFSMIALLAAVYLILDYQKHPTRLRLLGIWLGLLFNIASNETAYAIILIIPLLWWLRSRALTWKNFNLTAIWYIFPALKAAYLLLLILSDQDFYRSDLFNSASDSPKMPSNIFNTFAAMVNVYRNTFIDGWQEALTALNQNSYLFLTAAMLALVGGIAWHLARAKDADTFPSARQGGIWLASGLLLIVPAVGVLIWIEGYRDDLWRLYFYVPIAAAVVIFSLIVLLTALIARPRYRNAAVIILCIILMFPALSRLLLQHERFVTSANVKAQVLASIMELAPQIDPAARVILLTDMTITDLRTNNMSEFTRNMLDSAFYALYQDKRPQFAFLCRINQYLRCYTDDIELTEFHLQQDTDYRDVVLLRLYDDGSVELLYELPQELGSADGGGYDVNRLVKTSAPLPPRAATMLGSALHQ